MILSIETSTTVCSIAVHRDHQLLALQELHLERSHSSYLAELVENTIRYAGGTMKDVQAVAISEGPGSYTGLRIGTSTAKGLCYTLGIPLVAVSTLKAMACEVASYQWEWPSDVLLCPMLDARRMEVYTALYTMGLEEVEKVHPKVVDETSFGEYKDKTLVLFGNGAAKCKEVLNGDSFQLVEGITPSAKFIGELAIQKLEKEEVVDMAYFEPFYLKDFMIKPSKKKPFITGIGE
ncbi:tRNA (adenosine(37)-N6)-threonylcarbamoyltransferase complex dimerization subunit type 1 TsaB [Rapidithrix thailandica]|uniref:tRNA (Adenosine(37)-N6)-threonylcarbamoyltransferase complex dimerization subunit type 1 TsaB n=1 Tax=Rapidithrix thailandica TaxID=413964 RepID=A0AAW9SBQ2_9BACT